MLIEKTLNVIKGLTEEILTLDTVDRVKNYLTVKSLLAELRNEGEDKEIPLSMFDGYANTLLGHCRAIAGLEANDGNDEQQHLRWIYAEIDKFRSAHCFNI